MYRTGLRWVSLTALGALALAACSSEDVSGGAGGSGGSGADGASGATSGASTGGGPACTPEAVQAELPAVDLFLALDASNSMYLPASGASTRWNLVTSALLAFFRDPASAGVGIDLGFFPVPLEDVPDSCTSDTDCGEAGPCFSKICLNVLVEQGQYVRCESNTDCEHGTRERPTCRTIGDCSTAPGMYCFTESVESCDGTCSQSGICSRFVSCRAAAHARPAVSLSVLPDAQPALARAVQGQTPAEDTTPNPALAAAVERARGWAMEHPDHDVAVVLAMAGLPTACFTEDATEEGAAAELATIAADGAADGVKSHVLGVFSELEIADGAGALLDSVAEAGGTGKAVLIDAASNVSAAVAGALAELRGLERGCEFRAPLTTDYDAVNVVIRSSTASRTVPRVRDAGACDGTRGGWHYDAGPGSTEPERIVLCATSCVDLRIAPGATVEFELGCASQTLD